MIDKHGYRANVGIVIVNGERKVLWARRVSRDGWQFPQGGLMPDESPEDAAYRELHEEVGLMPEHVRLLGRTRDWLRYDLPVRARRGKGSRPPIRGQKQTWFLFEFTGKDSDIALDASETPEFDEWRWVDFWQPVDEIVAFKRKVYRRALDELSSYVSVPAPARPRTRHPWLTRRR